MMHGASVLFISLCFTRLEGYGGWEAVQATSIRGVDNMPAMPHVHG